MNIVILEDDPDQAAIVSSFLTADGHLCTVFPTGARFRDALAREQYDLIMIDWMLPDTTGIEVLKWVRTTLGWDIPVLFVTSRDESDDIALALETGADDYMVKPVFRRELIGRIHALHRRFSRTASPPANRSVGHITIDSKQHKMLANGEDIDLTPKEFALAEYILDHCGSLVSRNDLLHYVWGIDAKIHTRTVDTHISRIRNKLGLTPENGWKLSPVYNHGYRLEKLPEEDDR